MKKAIIFTVIFSIFILLTGFIIIRNDNQEIYQGNKQEIKSNLLKLKKIENKVRNETKTFRTQAFTVLDTNDINKTENVKLAISVINNIVIEPGQEFSFNNILGERTEEKGYKIAGVIKKDKNGNHYKGLGVGGGICQVSSTIYIACKQLNIDVLERNKHSIPVDYCDLDDDAMVNWGTSDFRFRNNLDENITIKLYLEPYEDNTTNEKVVCEIW